MPDRLARRDQRNEHIEHVGSAVFAVPPGAVALEGFIGEPLVG